MRWRGCGDGYAVTRSRGYAVLRFCRATAQPRNLVAHSQNVTLETLIIFGSGIAAGAINAIAGGGTLLTFPTLLLFGTPEKVANATSTLALVIGTSGSLYGFRQHARNEPHFPTHALSHFLFWRCRLHSGSQTPICASDNRHGQPTCAR